MEAWAIAMVGNIAMEMERHGLCYVRTLERYKEHGMPWLPRVTTGAEKNSSKGRWRDPKEGLSVGELSRTPYE